MDNVARGAQGKPLIFMGDDVQPVNLADETDREELEQFQEQSREQNEQDKKEELARRKQCLENPEWTAGSFRVLILEDLPEEKTLSGILLAGCEPPDEGTIVSVGPGVKGYEAGDKVLFSKWSGGTTNINGIKHIFVHYRDIVGSKKVRSNESRSSTASASETLPGSEDGCGQESGEVRYSEGSNAAPS